jgi:catechol 2,3-dioxygenase-like lactoylglutathione lyase family enzyme
MIKIREIDHVVLRVTDLERMIDFYCRVIGCTVERRRDNLGLVHLRAGRSQIDLVPVDGPVPSAPNRCPISPTRAPFASRCRMIAASSNGSTRRHT